MVHRELLSALTWTGAFQQTRVGLSRGFEAMDKVASRAEERGTNGASVAMRMLESTVSLGSLDVWRCTGERSPLSRADVTLRLRRAEDDSGKRKRQKS